MASRAQLNFLFMFGVQIPFMGELYSSYGSSRNQPSFKCKPSSLSNVSPRAKLLFIGEVLSSASFIDEIDIPTSFQRNTYFLSWIDPQSSASFHRQTPQLSSWDKFHFNWELLSLTSFYTFIGRFLRPDKVSSPASFPGDVKSPDEWTEEHSSLLQMGFRV